MLFVSSLLWKANTKSYKFSRDYTTEWVERLYRGFNRNLTVPFEFVLFTDCLRDYSAPIKQQLLGHHPITYSSYIEPFKMNRPMILVGLDTLIVGNIDHLAEHCLTGRNVALPSDPFEPSKVCNGVALIPAGHKGIYDAWKGENDMAFLRATKGIKRIDDLFPKEVISYKAHYKKDGLGNAKIVYFHGRPKMHQIEEQELLEHWK